MYRGMGPTAKEHGPSYWPAARADLRLKVRAVQGLRWGYSVRGLLFETMVSWLDSKGVLAEYVKTPNPREPGAV